MTGKELLQTKISYFGKITYNTPLCDITLLDWIGKYALRNRDNIMRIRETNKNDSKTAKQMKADLLPYVTLTGHYASEPIKQFRRLGNEDYVNPIMGIDVDIDENTNVGLTKEEVKQKLIELPFVFLVSDSCRSGVYALAFIDTTKDYKRMYDAMREEIMNRTGIEVDKNCGDITRARFASYDDKVMIRVGEVEQWNREAEIKIIERNQEDDKWDWNDEFTFKVIYLLIEKFGYRSNEYQEWLQDGFRLATLGTYGKILFMYLSEKSDNYQKDKAIEKWNECSRRSRYSKSCLSYYFGKLKKKLGKDWMKKIQIEHF